MPEPGQLSPAAEGLLTFARIAELQVDPVQGDFDAAHLKEIHRRIFQDIPQYSPGTFRAGAAPHIKLRVLEGSGHRYRVHYAAADKVEAGLPRALEPLRDADSLQGLSEDAFCRGMAEVYADLDYLHPFHEGNSRALRVFTTQLANEMGYCLHWNTKDADAAARDRLYIARDKAVTVRAFPGLDREKAMEAATRAEETAYLEILARYAKADSLESVIAQASYKCDDAPGGPAECQRRYERSG